MFHCAGREEKPGFPLRRRVRDVGNSYDRHESPPAAAPELDRAATDFVR